MGGATNVASASIASARRSANGHQCIFIDGSGTAALAPVDLIEGIAGAVGFVAPWAEVEIVDEAGTPLSNGRDGIIRYRTPGFLGGPVRGQLVLSRRHWLSHR
jgi:hypothetical protein